MTHRDHTGQRVDRVPASWPGATRAYTASLHRRHYSPGTVRGRLGILKRFAEWAVHHGASRPRALAPGHLERYQDALAGRPVALARPLSVAVQSLHLSAVRTFLRWCAEQGVIEADPGSHLQLPRLPFRLPRLILTAAQAEEVLAQPDLAGRHGIRDRAILEVLYSTGMRRMELIQLTVGDVRAADRTCVIRAGKGRRDRIVPIGVRAIAWVSRYLSEEHREWDGRPATLFLTGRGRPFAPARLSELVNRYLRLAGLGPGGSCHVFRHTTATLMLNGGADIRHIQAMLGHTDIRTTARYTHVAVDALRAVHQRTHPGERPPGATGPSHGSR